MCYRAQVPSPPGGSKTWTTAARDFKVPEKVVVAGKDQKPEFISVKVVNYAATMDGREIVFLELPAVSRGTESRRTKDRFQTVTETGDPPTHKPPTGQSPRQILKRAGRALKIGRGLTSLAIGLVAAGVVLGAWLVVGCAGALRRGGTVAGFCGVRAAVVGGAGPCVADLAAADG